MSIQEDLINDRARTYTFLNALYQNPDYPRPLVDEGRQILVGMCFQLEQNQTKSPEDLYELSHASTVLMNDLQKSFAEQGFRWEEVEREGIVKDFAFVAEAYGFDADAEQLVAPRTW